MENFIRFKITNFWQFWCLFFKLIFFNEILHNILNLREFSLLYNSFSISFITFSQIFRIWIVQFLIIIIIVIILILIQMFLIRFISSYSNRISCPLGVTTFTWFPFKSFVFCRIVYVVPIHRKHLMVFSAQFVTVVAGGPVCVVNYEWRTVMRGKINIIS